MRSGFLVQKFTHTVLCETVRYNVRFVVGVKESVAESYGDRRAAEGRHRRFLRGTLVTLQG